MPLRPVRHILELNLSGEAEEIAHEGFLHFQKLGMGYEAGKCLANEAIACGQRGKTSQALERFARAREIFEREQNLVWPSLLDLYQGLLLFQEGRYSEAGKLGAGAAKFFDQSTLSGKAVIASLLLARIALQDGDLAAAEREATSAAAKLARVQTPVLVYETWFVRGQIASSRGDRPAACAAYEKARKALETLRSQLRADELKISFVKNRTQVYEALVDLHLDGQGAEISVNEAFACLEAAKSRSMTAMMSRNGQSLPRFEAAQSREVQRVRVLREDLNWLYHRIELEQLGPTKMSRERVVRMQRHAQERENEFLRALRELPMEEWESASIEAPIEFSLSKLQKSLPEDTALVEYYSAGDRVVAAVVTRETIEITPVTLVSRIEHELQLLRFQLSKFRMGRGHVQQFEQPLLRAAPAHLEDLYVELIRPLRRGIRARRLVFVPHGALHFLPFHALRDGDEYIGDVYPVSYAPSATVFALCQKKAATGQKNALVLGIPDERAPQILTEAQSVAALLPDVELYLGEQATAKILREKGPQSGLLHIATHGVYRQDNPMFSAIRLGDGYLNLCDLYQLRLTARLVTLSGCATGMNFVAAGDELLGLQRGLFRAGATSLLLSLWDVHDRSTADLMQEFYRSYIQGNDAARSLSTAMRSLRQERPHPYFWAPFVPVGRVGCATVN